MATDPRRSPVSAWTQHLPVAAAALACLLFVRLGWWQLDRAREKQQLLDAYAENLNQPPLSLEAYLPRERFTAVRISGRFLDYTVLLDNQIRDKRPGVHVFTLFQPAAGPPSILVNRGWRPLGADRRITVPNPPPGRVELTGLLSAFPRPGIRLGEVDYRASAPRLVPYLEAAALGQALNAEIAPQVLLLLDDGLATEDGLVREWIPDVKPRPQRHRAYAWQWFSLAAAVVTVFAILKFRHRRP